MNKLSCRGGVNQSSLSSARLSSWVKIYVVMSTFTLEGSRGMPRPCFLIPSSIMSSLPVTLPVSIDDYEFVDCTMFLKFRLRGSAVPWGSPYPLRVKPSNSRRSVFNFVLLPPSCPRIPLVSSCSLKDYFCFLLLWMLSPLRPFSYSIGMIVPPFSSSKDSVVILFSPLAILLILRRRSLPALN